MLTRPFLVKSKPFALQQCILGAVAISGFLAIAGPAHGQPTPVADLRKTWTSADPPPGNDTEDAPFFTPFNSSVSWGGSVPCDTPPNDPTFTSGEATQNSTASPLSYMGTGTATASGDGGSCGCSITSYSVYKVRFTTDESYDVTVSGTFQDASFQLSAEAGSTFVGGVGIFTGTLDEMVTIPPGSYVLSSSALVLATFTTGNSGTLESSFDFSVQLSATGSVSVGETPTPRPSFFLTAPQPNPSRSISNLELVTDSRAQLTLTVYDVSGRAIRSLMDGPLSPGEHGISWDGRDRRGSRVPSGVYFLRAFSEERSAVRRIIRID